MLFELRPWVVATTTTCGHLAIQISFVLLPLSLDVFEHLVPEAAGHCWSARRPVLGSMGADTGYPKITGFGRLVSQGLKRRWTIGASPVVGNSAISCSDVSRPQTSRMIETLGR